MLVTYHGAAQDLDGVALPGASVLVQNSLTGAHAPLYALDGVTPILNPATADGYGRFSYKWAAGLYDITVTKDTYSATLPQVTAIEDPSIIYMVNDSGGTLSYGDVVHVSGDGLVDQADSDGPEAAASAVAVCVEGTLGAGSTGRFRTIGPIDRVGTPGAIGYLSSAGVITQSAPTSGFAVVMGRQSGADVFTLNISLPVELAP